MTFDHLLVNRTQNQMLGALSLAKGFAARGRGLLFRKPIHPNQVLWITDCSSIHTIGMSYALDVIFLDETGRVLKKCRNIAPFRIRLCLGARDVIEVHHTSTICDQIQPGDLLAWQLQNNA